MVKMPDVDYVKSNTWTEGDKIEVKINGITDYSYIVSKGMKLYAVIIIQGNEKV